LTFHCGQIFAKISKNASFGEFGKPGFFMKNGQNASFGEFGKPGFWQKTVKILTKNAAHMKFRGSKKWLF
jgi:hypothetical protein